MTTADDQALLHELAAKDAIATKLGDFCRGLDRRDVELAMSAFHDDGVDVHPPLGTWTAAEMPQRMREAFEQMFTDSQYLMAFPRIEVVGERASSEVYVWCAKRTPEQDEVGIAYLRLSGMVYLDRWERRGGDWRIARRRFVPSWELHHSLGAEPASIRRHYRPVAPSAGDAVDPDLDPRVVSRSFWQDRSWCRAEGVPAG